jgi:hypothetical protein
MKGRKQSTNNTFGGGGFEAVERSIRKGKVKKLFPTQEDAERAARRGR